MEALKQASSGTTAMVPAFDAPAPSGSIAELEAKLSAYQAFISNYIVESQEQKRIAVQQAEAAMAKKYEEKLLVLGAAAASPAPIANIAPAVTNELFSSRNAKVSAAAAAGKSRWGDLESQRAGGSIGFVVNGAVPIPPEVIAADHGLRNDGGVGGPTLAERIAVGANASPTSSSIPTSYQIRNAMVAAAGKDSRWGPMEVQKAAGVTVTPIAAFKPSKATLAVPVRAAASPPVTPELVLEADHGLRHDGGVGGLTLAERLASGAVGLTRPTITKTRMDYQRRNVKVAAAGKSSRWGAMEVERAVNVAAMPLVSAAPASVLPSELVAAADHGLRSDGGVGGPTLAERVNLGARLMGNK
jgi:hypothetical protein